MNQELKWVEVESSNISAVAYDNDTSILGVKFTSGSVYSYSDVSPDIFETMPHVPSVGRYFNMMVKTLHDYKKWSNEAELSEYIRSVKAG